eukprot:scaffold16630_cov177-Amphora_coffeaeformis.AAC.15
MRETRRDFKAAGYLYFAPSPISHQVSKSIPYNKTTQQATNLRNFHESFRKRVPTKFSKLTAHCTKVLCSSLYNLPVMFAKC